ncbi:hypothetical protein Fmac_003467 [Flemingia macrophylla]|uniref:Pentatricopeptide repeat-containing protein n=1 Tax=Flemingia macrophylla TaxID=520843 RepID=A0ABD1NMV6_9FABA
MLERNVVSWTSLINGYVGRNLAKEVLSLFFQIVEVAMEHNPVTMVCVISACAKLKDLELGKRVCAYISELGVELNALLVNALVDDMCMKFRDICAASRNAYVLRRGLEGWDNISKAMIDMYMKCGGIQGDIVTMVGIASACGYLGALGLAKRMDNRYVSGWTAAVGAMAMDGNTKGVIELFNKMLKQKVKPDDFLCWAVERTLHVIQSMPMELNDVVWGPMVLPACRKHNNVEFAHYAAERLT